MSKHFRYDDQTALVQTTGGLVHGYEYDGISIFKGIPYAKAKRFQDPEPISWKGIFEATGYGYACAVVDAAGLSKSMDFVERYTPQSEDCQNLNIWTPATDNGKRPVMVWLHGGAMSFGSSSGDDICEGDNIARYGDVVSVSINHRLNVLGFCDLSDLGDEKFKNSGNQGIADLVAALHWIHDNIVAFGGDPDNVTIFGQSGGGMKVAALLQTPAADGLFHKGIIMSGIQGGALADCVGSGRQMGEFLLHETGVSSVDALAEIPFPTLAEAFRKMRLKYRFHGVNAGEMPFRGTYYLGDAREVPHRPETSQIPLLVGSTFGEFDAFAARSYRKYQMTEEEQIARLTEALGEECLEQALPLFRKAYPNRPIIDLMALDCMFRCYINEFMNGRVQLNDCTWEYMFDLDMPSLGGIVPAHGNDLGFVFHTTDRAPGLQEPGVTEKIEKQIFQTVMTFIRTGDPNNSGIPEWRPSKPGQMHTMIFGKEAEVRDNYDQQLNALLVEKKLKKQLEFLYTSVARTE